MKKIKKFIVPVIVGAGLIFSSFKGEKKVVLVDIGHGGKDSGATIGAESEKNLMLSIAWKLEKLNNGDNIILTRNQDTDLSLEDRITMITKMKPDAVISLHANFSKNKDEKGPLVFTQKNGNSGKLGELALQEFTGAKNETKDLKILSTETPSILIETGFLSNDGDAKSLTSEKGQQEIAQKVMNIVKNLD